MGCASSSIDKEERVQICKERKRLMKQLLGYRGEFANAILAYLRALKNTGVTLRQFTESESLELENVPFSSGLPPSPPPPLPPSPPPPPPYSPDLRKLEGNQNAKKSQEEIIEIGEESGCTPPPPPIPSSSWDPWDLFETSSAQHETDSSVVEDVDEENWAETRSQFEEDEQAQQHVSSDKAPDSPPKNLLNTDVVDDDSSMMSGQTKNRVDMAMVVWRSKKSLTGIVKELDDYFLKASASGKEIAVMVDMGARNAPLHHDSKEIKAKGNNSGRVLSSVPWSWSSRSMHSTKDAVEVGCPIEPCRPGAHCITIEKLYAEEQILYKAVREEEMAKLEHQRKSLSLHKQENENTDLNKMEKTRSAVQSLQSDIVGLQELERRTCSSILSLIDEELHLQLVALLSGLIHMWKTMYECHQVQRYISQQVNHLTSHHNAEPTTECHREATIQLENEVKFWYNSFCRLTKCQREYVSTLCRWIQLTSCLVNRENPNHSASTVRTICEKWQLALDRLPEKVVAEGIKNFLLVIRSIILQQEQEFKLKKKSDKLERKLHKEINSLIEMEKKLEECSTLGDMESNLSPKHPLSVKRAKMDALKKQYENEKAKYLTSVQASRAMTLTKLHICLPHVFQALTGFSSACTQAFDIALNHAEQVSVVEQSHAEG